LSRFLVSTAREDAEAAGENNPTGMSTWHTVGGAEAVREKKAMERKIMTRVSGEAPDRTNIGGPAVMGLRCG
jgi:hypothetical protein